MLTPARITPCLRHRPARAIDFTTKPN